MNDRVKKMAENGSGVMVMSRKEAGEAYKAAKKVKSYEFTYWNRNRKKKEAK